MPNSNRDSTIDPCRRIPRRRGDVYDHRFWRGVWVSDRDLEDHALEAPVLTLDVPEDVLAEYEWVQEDLGYREFLIPARVLKLRGLSA